MWSAVSRWAGCAVRARGAGPGPTARALSCHAGAVCRVRRALYARCWRTLLVLPDGASLAARYPEPRRIIKLPLDLSKVSDEERKIRLDRRKPKKKVKIMDDVEDNFNAKKYLKFIKK